MWPTAWIRHPRVALDVALPVSVGRRCHRRCPRCRPTRAGPRSRSRSPLRVGALLQSRSGRARGRCKMCPTPDTRTRRIHAGGAGAQLSHICFLFSLIYITSPSGRHIHAYNHGVARPVPLKLDGHGPRIRPMQEHRAAAPVWSPVGVFATEFWRRGLTPVKGYHCGLERVPMHSVAPPDIVLVTFCALPLTLPSSQRILAAKVDRQWVFLPLSSGAEDLCP